MEFSSPDASRETDQGEEDHLIDQALIEALKNPRERANVLRIEADVAKFVSDRTRCTIEFAPDLTSYQRLLAHRVSQLYGLQTSSVPFGSGLSRVIAHKTQDTKFPPVQVIHVKDIYQPPEVERVTSPPDVVIKRRPGAAHGRLAPDGSTLLGHDGMSGGARSVKQREEEYKAARDRILGPEEHQSSIHLDDIAQIEEDARNRKAVFRDKIKEQQDPDYKRGSDRFPSPLHYEQMPFGNTRGATLPAQNIPSYSAEFQTLPRAHVHGHMFRAGPRPLPPVQYTLPYPGPGFGYPPRLVPFRSPPAGRPLMSPLNRLAPPPAWSGRTIPASGPPLSAPNPVMHGFPNQFLGYPQGYPTPPPPPPPRGQYYHPMQGAPPRTQEGVGPMAMSHVRTQHRRKPMPPKTDSDSQTQQRQI
eukprot:g7475.t1